MSEQNKLMIGLVVLLTALLVLMFVNRYGGFSIVFSGVFSQPNRSQAEGSLQLAVSACKQEVSASIGPALLQMDVDGISTRYQSQSQSYLVFLDIQIKGQERQPIYVECDVSAVTQRINRIRVNGPARDFNWF